MYVKIENNLKKQLDKDSGNMATTLVTHVKKAIN